ncbi:lipid II:glycine glycyltransferase FemX [Sphingobacterium psychroaquaticum]|uniref:Lipid II:glycine glycyltransferase (Peptidoglycan interpeptide bridge formation enzyme) n=1 Tax=Sphingobacterium psychroaquaticum TaxID=561061 RepID=A0A1X7J1K9_9SPHI|nr:peptidoglycan bridge formation glycyltransferase FemA/FemB family protein [Sphingobacterium psychroaquaticum]QBQ40175.1 peptidoglycan bridge formation glycyltransferase FemA/FemB family protein [Sphingobacterium psychroaquaticum]SMG21348.1 Lipid II:glycine glycyltransferase (Peptidoglycan interpeptide bridge formation enzyme) [Sphingobacterium psychroaquaticum]
MIADVEDKEIKEVFRTSIIQQTSYWSEVKKMQGVESKAYNFKVKKSDLFSDSEDNTYFVGDLLILIQNIDQEHCIAYVPYGPEIEPSAENQGYFLEQLSESLRSFLPSNCIMIRYDLSWESLWAKDEDCYDLHGNWIGVPDRKIQEIRFNFSTENWNLKKANTDILPSNTIFMDLKKNHDLLLGEMKPKTRYNINLSKRKGVKVRSLGLESLEIWYELYRQTAQRNNFFLHDISYFRIVLTARANDTLSPADVYLLVAEVDDVPLAAMFLVVSANRGTYLYGASATENRNYMATYALQWRAMELAKEKGCTEYDFFGVAPKADPSHPMYGLYRFKTGFGGSMYHRMGCWDYPLNKDKYQYYISMEFKNQSYHLS